DYYCQSYDSSLIVVLF
nr:immunoglobulin light chain junction region [Macaca mulatta]MOV68438.1 immunoglobulin light chain junction region [Macaca mulatta]MOV69261.1 immunoglobulin light chain junction region [Macaca mulatta]